jgi:hypothetical protein
MKREEDKGLAPSRPLAQDFVTPEKSQKGTPVPTRRANYTGLVLLSKPLLLAVWICSLTCNS